MGDNDRAGRHSPGKKKYLPFGTLNPTHHPYSEYAHIKEPSIQVYVQTLATAAIVPPVEQQPVVEVKPKRIPKRLQSTPGRAASKDLSTGAASSSAATEVDKLGGVPNLEGVGPCKKAACQSILKQLVDQQYENDIEREDIELEYERLVIELSNTEQGISIAEKKVNGLNEMQRLLELRHDQMLVKVEDLEKLREAQKTENTDLNNKIMVFQSEKSKAIRSLEKAQKALADAQWRRKKQELAEHVESGLSLGGSEISDGRITRLDSETVSVVSNIHSTSYDKLVSRGVLDAVEQPLSAKTLPAFLREELRLQPHHFDSFTKKRYEQLMERGLKSWGEQMDGSLRTASIDSKGSWGTGPDVLAMSYEEYTQISTPRRGPSRTITASLCNDVTNRVGNFFTGQSTASLASTKGSRKSQSLRLHRSNQVRLQPIDKIDKNGSVEQTDSTMGDDDSFDDPDHLLLSSSNVSISSPSLSQYSALSTGTDEYSATRRALQIDPVFYKEKSRTMWGRDNPVGKVRTGEITWGMEAFKAEARKMQLLSNRSSSNDKAKKADRLKPKPKAKDAIDLSLETVKTRALTVYHPDMYTFKDSLKLPMKS